MSKRDFKSGMDAAKGADDLIGVMVSVIVVMACIWGSWRIYAAGSYEANIILAALGQVALIMVARGAAMNGLRCLLNLKEKKARDKSLGVEGAGHSE